MCEQEDCESRKVWREVTMGLRINDMDKATAAKCSIEQKQRDEARIRKEGNIAWQTKVSETIKKIVSFIFIYYSRYFPRNQFLLSLNACTLQKSNF